MEKYNLFRFSITSKICRFAEITLNRDFKKEHQIATMEIKRNEIISEDEIIENYKRIVQSPGNEYSSFYKKMV